MNKDPKLEWEEYQKQKAAFIKDFEQNSPFDFSREEMMKEPQDRKGAKLVNDIRKTV